MPRPLLLLILLAPLVRPALSQGCDTPPPLRDVPSQTDPFYFGVHGYEAGEARIYQFGDVFLRSHGSVIMLWGEDECGLWVRAVESENGTYGEGIYQAIPKSASGNYEIPGAPGGGPLFTVKPAIQLIGGYPITLNIDIPAPPVVDEGVEADGVEADGVEAEWRNQQR